MPTVTILQQWSMQIPHVARISALLVKMFGVMLSVSAGKASSLEHYVQYSVIQYPILATVYHLLREPDCTCIQVCVHTVHVHA